MHSLWHDVHCLNSSSRDDLNLISSTVEAGCTVVNGSLLSSLKVLIISFMVM